MNCKKYGNQITNEQKDEIIRQREGLPWKPKIHDTYWILAKNGKPQKHIWRSKALGRCRLKNHNVFKTKEEAARRAKKIEKLNSADFCGGHINCIPAIFPYGVF